MKLTQKTVAALALPNSRNEAIIFDDHLAGFGLGCAQVDQRPLFSNTRSAESNAA